jgi:F-type H+-transporting ATPase subunit b
MSFIPALLATDHTNPLIPEKNELVWGLVCFLIMLVYMSWLVFPKINRALAARTENIEGKLEQAERERQEAQLLLTQARQQLADAAGQAQQIVDQARQNADRLEQELRSQAEDQARRIVERAQATIDGETERARQSLRSEVGGMVVDLAERVVGDALDRDRQLRLIDQYIADLSNGKGSAK